MERSGIYSVINVREELVELYNLTCRWAGELQTYGVQCLESSEGASVNTVTSYGKSTVFVKLDPSNLSSSYGRMSFSTFDTIYY